MIASIKCEYSVAGDGPPLILVHGIGASRDTWAKALPVLTPHFTVVTYDLRGHGSSPMPEAEFDLDALLADLHALQTHLGFAEVHIAGHSLGGMIGPAYARAYPERVLSLGILSTAAFRTKDDSAKVWAVVDAMVKNGIPQVLPTLTDRWFTDEFIRQNPDIVKKRLEQVIETDAEVFLNVFRIYAGTEMAPWIHEVKTPSLIVTGENDGGCNPRLNKLINQALPNSQLIVLPDYKHSLLLEAGDVVAEHLVSFMSKYVSA